MPDPLSVNQMQAPLRNVAAFATLLERMVERGPSLPGLGVFFGPSGWGKTRSAIYGATRLQAKYVECGMFTTARSLIASVLKEYGGPARGSVEEMKERAIELMSAKPRIPLLIDEAHFVAGKRFVDLLRELSDKAGAPVILIGEEMLPAMLEQFERVDNRILERLPAQPCDADDLRQLVRFHCGKLAIADDLSAAILKVTEGNTRRIVINLDKAKEAARVRGVDRLDLDGFGGSQAIVGRTVFTPRVYR